MGQHGGAREGTGHRPYGNKWSGLEAPKPQKPPRAKKPPYDRTAMIPDIPEQTCVHCGARIAYERLMGGWTHMSSGGRKKGSRCGLAFATPPPRSGKASF